MYFFKLSICLHLLFSDKIFLCWLWVSLVSFFMFSLYLKIFLLLKGEKRYHICEKVVHACMLSCFSCVWLCATLWTVACQPPLSVGFSRQEHWSGLPCLSLVIFPTQGSSPRLLSLLHWQAGSLPLGPPGKPMEGVGCGRNGKGVCQQKRLCLHNCLWLHLILRFHLPPEWDAPFPPPLQAEHHTHSTPYIWLT